MAQRKESAWGLGPLLVLAAAGAGCFCAASFMLFFGALPISTPGRGPAGWFMRMLCIAAVAFALLLVPRIQEHFEQGDSSKGVFSSGKLRNLLIALIAFLPLVIMNGTAAPSYGAWNILWTASWLLFGLFGGYFLSCWGSFYAKALRYFGRREVIESICLSLIIAALLGIIFLLSAGSEVYELRLSAPAAALLAAQFIFYAYVNGRLEATDTMGYSEYTELWRQKMPLRMRFVRPFVVGWGLGVTSVLWVAADGMQTVFAAFLVLLALICLIYYCVGIVRHEFLSIKTVDRLSVFFLAMGLLITPFTAGLLRSIMLGMAMFGAVAFFAQHWLVIIQGTTCYNSHPSHVFAHHAYSLLGILCGFSIIALPIELSPLSLNELCAVGSVTSVGLLILAYTLVTYENTVWEELFQYMNEIEEIPLDEETVAMSYEEHLNERLTVLAQKHGLTAREKEVFELLARGRNAAVVARELVISPYTAKTHIYHVYQKFGVKAQQELIDVINEFH